MRSLVVITALALLAACAPSPEPATQDTSAAVQARSGYMGGSAGLSRRVFATWHGTTQGDTLDLLLLVLWRGAPGWQNAPHHSGGRMPDRSDERAPGLNPGVPSPIVRDIRLGSVELGIHFDVASRTVGLIGEEVALGDRNVILVDRIDGAGGPPRIVDVLRIPPRFPLEHRPEPELMPVDCLGISWSAGDSMARGTPVECEDRPAPATFAIRAAVNRLPLLRAFAGYAPW